MAYTDKNFKSGKDLRTYFESGKEVTVYQPGPFGGAVRDGKIALEGPHYPEPHRWYASGECKDGMLVALKGSKARWVDGKFIATTPKITPLERQEFYNRKRLYEDIQKYGTEEEKILLFETGEMGQSDIEEGGENYEWAKDIEDKCKEIEKRSNGKFTFEEMRPFDKYQGPYGYGHLNESGVKVWDAQDEFWMDDWLYFEFFSKNQDENWLGNIDEIITAINGDKEIEQQLQANVKKAQEGWPEEPEDETIDDGITQKELFPEGEGQIKLNKEDIEKYGTEEEKKILKENWKGRLQKQYRDFEEFKAYDEIYELARRLGYDNAEEAWEANPLVSGSVNPEEYHRVKEEAEIHTEEKKLLGENFADEQGLSDADDYDDEFFVEQPGVTTTLKIQIVKGRVRILDDDNDDVLFIGTKKEAIKQLEYMFKKHIV